MLISVFELKTYNPYDAYLNKIGDDRFKHGQFNDKVKKLPEKFQDFVFDTVPADFIKNRISRSMGLNQNQSKETATIVMELVLADLYLGNIVNEIKNRLGADEMKAKTIAGLIVAELFGPILEDLKKMHVEKFAKGKTLQPFKQGDDRTVDLRQ